ncbi:acyltransferase [Sinomonas sp. JGH33]|uniref:Acyltransferase n=1 Tax=Sinomonas terricola TaxID=3110330 RepID=A0ABU5TBB9_9MICC|nr:acyltransferase [Sinomonas sp. JGH33]MEA5456991.1 acyltransferase [Sinomonas sp. JGH33]
MPNAARINLSVRGKGEAARSDDATVSSDNRALNVIRSAAALLVVLGHVRILFFEDYSNASHYSGSALLYSVTSLGSEAVIVFFVLSGYWVGGGALSRLRRGTFTWRSYSMGRLTRLWLVLVPALVLTLIVDQAGRISFSGSDIYAKTSLYAGVPSTISYSPATFLGNLLFVQSIHVSEYGLNKPLWSLAYEFWYYLLFPAALMLVWKGISMWLRVAGGAVLVLGAAIAGPTVLLLFPAWLVGAVVAAYKQPIARVIMGLRPGTLGTLRCIGALGTLAAMVFAHEVVLPSRLGAWIISLAAGCMLCFFVSDVAWRGRPGRVLSAISSTAHFSYSLYAIHMPIVAILAAAFVPEFSRRWPLDVWHAGIALGIVAVLAAISFTFARFTEQRTDAVRTWIRVRTGKRRTTSI